MEDGGWADLVLQAAKAPQADGEKTATARLNVDLDDELHMRLKTHCLKNRTKINRLIPALLEAYLAEAGE